MFYKYFFHLALTSSKFAELFGGLTLCCSIASIPSNSVSRFFTDSLSLSYSELNSVKNTTINIWLNDGVY